MSKHLDEKTLNRILWVAQVVLGFMFIMSGSTKISVPYETLVSSLPWLGAVPEMLVRIIGGFELLGAIGILLPSFNSRAIMTICAAIGLASIMLFATMFHLYRFELTATGINVSLLSMCIFVAWGRNKLDNVAPKKFVTDKW